MPNTTDNQDYGAKQKKDNNDDPKPVDVETSTGPAMGNLPLTSKKDENSFNSDDQKGKKVDGDPEKEDDQPVNQK